MGPSQTMSRTLFGTRFREAVGESPIRYLAKVRLGQAAGFTRFAIVMISLLQIGALFLLIRDANIAEESAHMTKFNVLNQSGIAALAQANQSTSAVLSLLR